MLAGWSSAKHLRVTNGEPWAATGDSCRESVSKIIWKRVLSGNRNTAEMTEDRKKLLLCSQIQGGSAFGTLAVSGAFVGCVVCGLAD